MLKGIQASIKNFFFQSSEITKEQVDNFLLEYLAQEAETKQIASDSKLEKLLFLSANPLEMKRIQTDREYLNITQTLSKNSFYKMLHPEFALTLDRLIDVMYSEPSIVHFSGHGKEKGEGLILADKNNEPVTVANESIKRLFKRRKETTKLVFFNCCHSETQAQMISEFGIYVIGVKKFLDDDLALLFSDIFYQSFAKKRPIEDCYDNAITFLLTNYPLPISDYPVIWKNGNKLDI